MLQFSVPFIVSLTWTLYRIESLRPPGRALIAAVLRDTQKRIFVWDICVGQCHPLSN